MPAKSLFYENVTSIIKQLVIHEDQPTKRVFKHVVQLVHLIQFLGRKIPVIPVSAA
jgi:hypothetical protein